VTERPWYHPRWWWVLVAVVVLVAATPVVAYFGWFRGEELGRVEVGDAPTHLTIGLAAPTRVELWVEVDVTIPRRFDDHDDHVDELPRVLELEVKAHSGREQLHDRECNVFAVRFFDWMGNTGTGVTESSNLHYVARLYRCGFDAPAGTTRIEVRRHWLDPVWAEFRKTVLIARKPAPDPGLPWIQWHDPR
jgi:hypothetical protein